MPEDFGFSVLVFIAVRKLFVFYHLVFGFRKNTSGFSVLVSGVGLVFPILSYLGSSFSSI